MSRFETVNEMNTVRYPIDERVSQHIHALVKSGASLETVNHWLDNCRQLSLFRLDRNRTLLDKINPSWSTIATHQRSKFIGARKIGSILSTNREFILNWIENKLLQNKFLEALKMWIVLQPDYHSDNVDKEQDGDEDDVTLNDQNAYLNSKISDLFLKWVEKATTGDLSALDRRKFPTNYWGRVKVNRHFANRMVELDPWFSLYLLQSTSSRLDGRREYLLARNRIPISQHFYPNWKQEPADFLTRKLSDEDKRLLLRSALILSKVMLHSIFAGVPPAGPILFLVSKHPEMLDKIESLKDLDPIWRKTWNRHFGWDYWEAMLHPAVRRLQDQVGGRSTVPSNEILDRIPLGLPSVKELFDRFESDCFGRGPSPSTTRPELHYLSLALGIEPGQTRQTLCEKVFLKGETIRSKYYNDPGQDRSPVRSDWHYLDPSLIDDQFGRTHTGRIPGQTRRGQKYGRVDISDYSTASNGDLKRRVIDPKGDSVKCLDRWCDHPSPVVKEYLAELAHFLGIESEDPGEICRLIRARQLEWTKEWTAEETKRHFGCDEEDDDCLEDPLSGEHFSSPQQVVKVPLSESAREKTRRPGMEGNYLAESLLEQWLEVDCLDKEFRISDLSSCLDPEVGENLSREKVEGVVKAIQRYLRWKKYLDGEGCDEILDQLLMDRPEHPIALTRLKELAEGLGIELLGTPEEQEEFKRLLQLADRPSDQQARTGLEDLQGLTDRLRKKIAAIYLSELKERWDMTLEPEEMRKRFNLRNLEPLIDPWTGLIPRHPHQLVRVGNKYIHYRSLLNYLEEQQPWTTWTGSRWDTFKYTRDYLLEHEKDIALPLFGKGSDWQKELRLKRLYGRLFKPGKR
jgi:hypothetical protein